MSRHNTLKIVNLVSEDAEGPECAYSDAAIFGLLDVLMVADRFVGNARIALKQIESHPVDSSIFAMRKAGQDAGRKILNVLRHGGG